jgi:hypothetical protein
MQDSERFYCKSQTKIALKELFEQLRASRQKA